MKLAILVQIPIISGFHASFLVVVNVPRVISSSKSSFQSNLNYISIRLKLHLRKNFEEKILKLHCFNVVKFLLL